MSVASKSIDHSTKELNQLIKGVESISLNIDSINLIATSNISSISEITEVAYGLDTKTANLNEKLQKFRT